MAFVPYRMEEEGEGGSQDVTVGQWPFTDPYILEANPRIIQYIHSDPPNYRRNASITIHVTATHTIHVHVRIYLIVTQRMVMVPAP